jgi:hypothetical protein
VSNKPLEGGLFLGEVEYEFDRLGVKSRKSRSQSFTGWSAAMSVSDTPTHVFIWLDRFTAQVIPLRDVPTDITATQLTQTLRSFIANATHDHPMADSPAPAAPTGLSAPASSPADAARPAAIPGVLAELGQLFRLFLLASARPALLYGRASTITVLGLSAVAAFALLERLDSGSNAEFFVYGLHGLGWIVCFALLLAWVLALTSGLAFRRILLLVSWLAFFAGVAFGVGNLFGRLGGFIATAIFAIEFFLVLGRGMTLLAGRPRRVSFVAGTLIAAGCWYLNGTMHLTPSFWIEQDPEVAAESTEDGAAKSIERESLAFEQALRLEAALAKIQRADTPDAQAFFVGFAGYGEERVFAGEIALAANRVAERYGAGTRALQLVNDRRDPGKLPWATVGSLNHALRKLGQVMDVERDVLFLALSSHGSKGGLLSVETGGRLDRNLHAEELAQMLRDSGIRWKVVVVSACYSGKFLEPLKDEHTVVISASAEDRTSFGCSDERDLTYFGEAFYRDALPAANSLREAFETARVAIGKREGEEGIKESLPQAHFGALIEQQLIELDAARGLGMENAGPTLDR